MERQRLAWRCRRGMLELDLMLEAFLARGYERLDHRQRHLFNELLELQDQELYEQLMEITAVDDREKSNVIALIRNAAAS